MYIFTYTHICIHLDDTTDAQFPVARKLNCSSFREHPLSLRFVTRDVFPRKREQRLAFAPKKAWEGREGDRAGKIICVYTYMCVCIYLYRYSYLSIYL